MAATKIQLPSGEFVITPDSSVASDQVRIGGPDGVPKSRGSRHRVIVDFNGATGYTVKARLFPRSVPVGDLSFALTAALTTVYYPRNDTAATAADAAMADMTAYDVVTDGDDLVIDIATSSPSGGPPKIYVRAIT